MWFFLQLLWLSSGWPLWPQLAVAASTSWYALLHERTVSLWLRCWLHHVHRGKWSLWFDNKTLTSCTVKLRVPSGEKWPPVNLCTSLSSGIIYSFKVNHILNHIIMIYFSSELILFNWAHKWNLFITLRWDNLLKHIYSRSSDVLCLFSLPLVGLTSCLKAGNWFW